MFTIPCDIYQIKFNLDEQKWYIHKYGTFDQNDTCSNTDDIMLCDKFQVKLTIYCKLREKIAEKYDGNIINDYALGELLFTKKDNAIAALEYMQSLLIIKQLGGSLEDIILAL